MNQINQGTSGPERIIICFGSYITRESKNSSVTCYYCLIFQVALKGGIPLPGVALILKLPLEGQLANFAFLRVALNLKH